MNSLRLRLARFIAPAGADVHDPDTTACPAERAVLEAAEQFDLYRDVAGRVHLDVSDTVKFVEERGWVEGVVDPFDNLVFRLTMPGEAELHRLRELG